MVSGLASVREERPAVPPGRETGGAVMGMTERVDPARSDRVDLVPGGRLAERGLT